MAFLRNASQEQMQNAKMKLCIMNYDYVPRGTTNKLGWKLAKLVGNWQNKENRVRDWLDFLLAMYLQLISWPEGFDTAQCLTIRTT